MVLTISVKPWGGKALSVETCGTCVNTGAIFVDDVWLESWPRGCRGRTLRSPLVSGEEFALTIYDSTLQLSA